MLEIGDERIELTAGDCITFDPRRPHRVTAIGDETVVCVDVDQPAVVLSLARAAAHLAFPLHRCDDRPRGWPVFKSELNGRVRSSGG